MDKKGEHAEMGCANCRIRARYERNPKSLVGRFWRWHIRWCPGWKKYFRSLPPEERARLSEKYGLPEPKEDTRAPGRPGTR